MTAKSTTAIELPKSSAAISTTHTKNTDFLLLRITPAFTLAPSLSIPDGFCYHLSYVLLSYSSLNDQQGFFFQKNIMAIRLYFDIYVFHI